jgi:protein SCO1/2
MNPTILITFVLMALTLLPLQGGCAKRSNLPATETSSKPSHSTGTILQTYQYSELHSLDDFAFTERDGSDFGKTNLDGKVWIASFFFSSCKFECSDQNRTIRDEIHEKLAGLDFTVVSITCDPANDTVSVLNQYANEFTTHPDKWKFLTAPMSAIQTMADRNFKVIVEPAIHSKRLLLVDKWGRFRERCPIPCSMVKPLPTRTPKCQLPLQTKPVKPNPIGPPGARRTGSLLLNLQTLRANLFVRRR